MLKTFKITITGQVQGVGFRPFVFVLVTKKNLTGKISNNEKGVIIYLSGAESEVRSFYQKLIKNPPPVSFIQTSDLREVSFQKFDEFRIVSSTKDGKLNLPLTPDFAICENCKNEIVEIENRRYNYPFTTCVNCGPRWAITKTFPFERSNTTIDDFEMCSECNGEYSNSNNRRFHSQTNTCKTCGIVMVLRDHEGVNLNVSRGEIFKKTAEFLKDGKIIAIKNTSGYLLCCDASNKKVVQTMRQKKEDQKKPFAILYPSMNLLEQHLKINKKQRRAFESTQRPIVIISKTDFKGSIALTDIAPDLNQIGIMLPYTGILELLSTEIKTPIIATSGNLHGSPILFDDKESLDVLKNVADYFLDHNLEIVNPQDDSVVKYSTKFNHEVLFRRSRGYAPNYFGGKIIATESILAMGGHLKSTIAFLPNDYLYISQYLGNLDNYDVYKRFTNTIEQFINLFDEKPNVVLIDSHPAYHSSLYGREIAKKERSTLYEIQHHKAHFASVLGEHELFEDTDPILGVVWDGTGYGEDGQIWGGEFFNYQNNKINRLSHFEYFDWLAGDKMAKEPRISLVSLATSDMESVLSEKFKEKEIAVYKTLKRKNELKTSSVGRLFDAVASLLEICDINTYEGEAAILLENRITRFDLENCKSYSHVDNENTISTSLLFRNLYSDYKKGTKREQIILNFIYTLASIILDFAQQNKYRKIACSGGVFQNTVLIDMLKELAGNKHKLYFNRNLAPNDENIAYGQIMYHINCTNP